MHRIGRRRRKRLHYRGNSQTPFSYTQVEIGMVGAVGLWNVGLGSKGLRGDRATRRGQLMLLLLL